ncbi:MAG TPA: hypothetical protein V6C95_20040 [Coleofasciculaceae cyanobacterium]
MVERLGKSSQPDETFFHTGNYSYPGFNNVNPTAQTDLTTRKQLDQEER